MTAPKSQPALPPAERAQMEQAYAQMLSAVVQMARVLGKPCPIVTREERRAQTSGTMPATQQETR